MPVDTELFSSIVREIYEATLDHPRWEATLSRVVDTLGGRGGAFLLSGEGGNFINIATVGSEFEAIKAYNAYYHHIDPVARSLLSLPVGLVSTSADLAASSFGSADEFFNDWARPNEVSNAIFVNVYRVRTGTCSLCLSAPDKLESFASNDNLRIVGSLIPHLQVAARVTAAIDAIEIDRRRFGAALDAITHGLVFLETGRVVHMNRAAAAILAARDVLELNGGQLHAVGASDNARLQATIGRTNANSPRGGGPTAIGRPSGKRSYFVFAIPSQVRDADPKLSSNALVIIIDPLEPQVLDSPTLMSLFGLTNAEAVVALKLLDGKTLKGIADELRVTLSTVRIHLSRVYDKTETHKQSQLVRLLSDLDGTFTADRSGMGVLADVSTKARSQDLGVGQQEVGRVPPADSGS